MDKSLPLKERSIRELYMDSQDAVTYMIPIYQRNYAWEQDEITALINDVHDSAAKDNNKPYYIGTLVTYKRGDNVYEVIDGQQRLTTIYIILKALKIGQIPNNLKYGARKVSDSTIEKLGEQNLNDGVDTGIVNGYKYAEKAINEYNEDERKLFMEYFLDKVHIIHYNVPKDVNLNHYFEVMNSRGEQLEKHEIVKSKLSKNLNDKELATFSHVWEACSEMNMYIQQAFSKKRKDDTRDKIFGQDLNKFIINSFEGIPEQDDSEGKESIMNLLNYPIEQIKEDSDKERNDRFQPIIDFPNFLLIVLKVTRMTSDFFAGTSFDPTKFILDDKELLNEFEDALNNANDKVGFAKLFAFNLLKAKYLLDNYIVHHTLNEKDKSEENPWKLQYFCRKGNSIDLSNIAGDSVEQREMVHLLSMFEVAFTPKQRKNYLFYCMMYLFEHKDPTGDEYLKFQQSLAHKYFFDVYLNSNCLNERKLPKPNAFDSVMLANRALNLARIDSKENNFKAEFERIYEQGKSDISLFVFNYTDYILWKKYADELRGTDKKKEDKERKQFFEDLGCSDLGLELFEKFYFSRTRKSLEHFYPQAKAGVGKPLGADEINCFGNFAMIGAEINSAGSDWDPKVKISRYTDQKTNPVSIASLKFKIMMQMCKDNPKGRDENMAWNAEDMQIHQQKMLDILFHKQ